MSRDDLRLGMRGCFFAEIDARGGPRRSKGDPGVAFGRKSNENHAEIPEATHMRSLGATRSQKDYGSDKEASLRMPPYMKPPRGPGQKHVCHIGTPLDRPGGPGGSGKLRRGEGTEQRPLHEEQQHHDQIHGRGHAASSSLTGSMRDARARNRPKA